MRLVKSGIILRKFVMKLERIYHEGSLLLFQKHSEQISQAS